MMVRNFAKVAALGLGTLLLNVAPAAAQPGPPPHARANGHWDRDHRGPPPHAGPQARRDRDRDWRNWRQYDYNRYERGQNRYYADNYYRSGYRPVRVDRNTRIYRGDNGRYYCRRNDGTTGLIVGAALGGLLGNQLDRGGSSLLGTLIGAGGGALLGREVDRGNLSCR